jgi:hypothetical protein
MAVPKKKRYVTVVHKQAQVVEERASGLNKVTHISFKAPWVSSLTRVGLTGPGGFLRELTPLSVAASQTSSVGTLTLLQCLALPEHEFFSLERPPVTGRGSSRRRVS